MLLLRSILWCAFVALASPGAHAQTDAATAELLMRKSGMWEQLTGVAPQVRSGIVAAVAQAGASTGTAELARLSRLVDAAYSAERLRAVSLAVVSRSLNPRHVPELRAWFDTRVGQTITKLEEAASADDRSPDVIVREGIALLGDLSASRRAALEELVKVTQSAELMTRMNISGALAVQRGVSSVLPNGTGPTAAELQAALEAQRPQMLAAFTAISMASVVKTYDALPTADLERYVAFQKSEAGRNFHESGVLALEAALIDAAAEFGRGLPGTKAAANS